MRSVAGAESKHDGTRSIEYPNDLLESRRPLPLLRAAGYRSGRHGGNEGDPPRNEHARHERRARHLTLPRPPQSFQTLPARGAA